MGGLFYFLQFKPWAVCCRDLNAKISMLSLIFVFECPAFELLLFIDHLNKLVIGQYQYTQQP